MGQSSRSSVIIEHEEEARERNPNSVQDKILESERFILISLNIKGRESSIVKNKIEMRKRGIGEGTSWGSPLSAVVLIDGSDSSVRTQRFEYA